MAKYRCSACGYLFDEDIGCARRGIAPGTPWEEVPENFMCPDCCESKGQFSIVFASVFEKQKERRRQNR